MQKNFIPNSFESLGREWFVDQNHPQASDENDGTENSPFKTITRASNTMERYDTVIIGKGVYREEIPLKVNGHPYTPEWKPIFKAKKGQAVHIKGSDIFEGEWKRQGKDAFVAFLPENLLKPRVYNPFTAGYGRVFLEGEELLEGESWSLNKDGKSIKIKVDPCGKRVELTVRKRCFQPLFEGVVFVAVMGIRVDHAALPGPFCLARHESIMETTSANIRVKKSFNLSGTSTRKTRLFTGHISYLSTKNDKLFATVYDDTILEDNTYIYDATSDDHGKSWNRITDNRLVLKSSASGLFLDEENDILIKARMDFLKGSDPQDGCAGGNIDKYQGVAECSNDDGKRWHSRQLLGKNLVPGRIHKLESGEYILPCGKTVRAGDEFHQDIIIFRGKYDKVKMGISWKQISCISVTPDESACGLAEPHVTTFPNGRLIILLRMGAILPSQDQNGVPSVKFYSISDDKGETWTKPTPLLYEDGKIISSPRSYQDVFRSVKNGRVYAIFNICDQPTTGCDPRDRLQIMEISPKTLSVNRESVAMIEARHPECHPLIRYSNWIMFESRETLNPVMLMRASMSEGCPIRLGYDMSSYRYEIELPI